MGETKMAEAQKKTTKEPVEKKDHLGVYVHGTPETALFTVLLDDLTCGMFLMPNAQNVFWMGFTKYKVKDDKLFFKVQNSDPKIPESDTAPKKKPATTSTAQAGAKPKEEFISATLTPRKEYIQHNGSNDTKFIFMTEDISYWTKLGGWKKLGDARQLEGIQDIDHAHEIRKVCVAVIRRFGRVFVWS